MNSIHHDLYSNQLTQLPRSRNYQERSVPKFLKKIFSILEENNHSEYVSWSNDGTAMVIKKPTDFANKVLPLFFKHSNFSSFIRQLNMYQFKKSKNPRFDHIYTHQSFQHGKIDLLRNIQRKGVEIASMTPMISQSFRAEEEIDVDGLVQENMLYKKIHNELTTQVGFIENKMKVIKTEVAKLCEEQKKSEANEKFLRNVLKSLTKVYGFESIANIIENDVEETEEQAPTTLPASKRLEACFDMYSNVNNGSVSQTVGSNSSENGTNEDYSNFSSEDNTEHFSTNDTPQSFDNSQFYCDQSKLLKGEPLFMLDFTCGDNINNDENEVPCISPRLSKINSFAIWVDELKNPEWNPDMYFCQMNTRFMGDLNIENF